MVLADFPDLTGAWGAMRADRDAHMPSSIWNYVRENPEAAEVEEILFRHLTRCSWCRNTLWQSLLINRVTVDHPLYLLLEDAETWERENRIALAARDAARQHLHENGAVLIFARDGKLLAQQPNGSIVELGSIREGEQSPSASR